MLPLAVLLGEGPSGGGVTDQGGFAASFILTLNRKERGRLPVFEHHSLDF